MNITLAPAAAKFVQRMLRFDGGPQSGFRLSVKPGGCSGFAAEFSVEAAPQEGERVVEIGGIRFFLGAESRLLLDGVTIDFVDSPLSTGFVFHDPKAKSCGCSTPADEASKLPESVSIHAH